MRRGIFTPVQNRKLVTQARCRENGQFCRAANNNIIKHRRWPSQYAMS